MIIDPVRAFKWMKGAEKSNIQQSGIDITLKSINLIHPGGALRLEGKKVFSHPLTPREELYYLAANCAYDFSCIEYVDIPKRCCALVIQRSSLNRLGVFITTGLYDGGFHNFIGGVLHTHYDVAIERGTRIGQVVFMKSAGRGVYGGQYNATH